MARYDCEGTSFTPGAFQLRFADPPRTCEMPSLEDLAVSPEPTVVHLCGDSHLRQLYLTLGCTWWRAGLLDAVDLVQLPDAAVQGESEQIVKHSTVGPQAPLPPCHDVTSITLDAFLGVVPGTTPPPPKNTSRCSDISYRGRVPVCLHSTANVTVCLTYLRNVNPRKPVARRSAHACMLHAAAASKKMHEHRQLTGPQGRYAGLSALVVNEYLARYDGGRGYEVLASALAAEEDFHGRLMHVAKYTWALRKALDPKVTMLPINIEGEMRSSRLMMRRLAVGNGTVVRPEFNAVIAALGRSRDDDGHSVIYPMSGLGADGEWHVCKVAQYEQDTCKQYEAAGLRACRNPAPEAECNGNDSHHCFWSEQLQEMAGFTLIASGLTAHY